MQTATASATPILLEGKRVMEFSPDCPISQAYIIGSPDQCVDANVTAGMIAAAIENTVSGRVPGAAVEQLEPQCVELDEPGSVLLIVGTGIVFKRYMPLGI